MGGRCTDSVEVTFENGSQWQAEHTLDVHATVSKLRGGVFLRANGITLSPRAARDFAARVVQYADEQEASDGKG